MLGIIIPTKNNSLEFFDCIRSIHKFTGGEYKVYVADTGSTTEVKEESKALLTELFGEHYAFIEYDYYNFAKINNDVVRNHLDSAVDLLLFCNNDIELAKFGLIDRMVQLLHSYPDQIGTCGARLLYKNNTIQHDGQMIPLPTCLSDELVSPFHRHAGTPHSEVTHPIATVVDGNTFALCMTSRYLFESIGMLSELYDECYEDVQYNLECQKLGRLNVLLESNLWAYHYESLSRGKGEISTQKMLQDFPTLKRFVAANFEPLEALHNSRF